MGNQILNTGLVEQFVVLALLHVLRESGNLLLVLAPVFCEPVVLVSAATSLDLPLPLLYLLVEVC
jgi:hypothetical protein